MKWIALALVVAALWGCGPIVHKSLLSSDIDRSTILVVSGSLYFVCLVMYGLMYHSARIRADVPKITASAWVALCALALVCGLFANSLYLRLLHQQKAHTVTALVFCAPVFTLLMAHVLLGERVRPMAAMGTALIVTGVLCISISMDA
jgi:drug/metabolite transporter (DMT)-like permease